MRKDEEYVYNNHSKCAFNSNETIKEYSKNHIELKKALEKMGTKAHK